MNIKLSAEDIKALELEKEIQRLQEIQRKNLSYENAEKIGNKISRLLDEQLKILHNNGMYRKDKKHLLVPHGCYLNLDLLKRQHVTTSRQNKLRRYNKPC
jgi:aromatic ring-opening dioxygenase LigB subunit